jgi:morphogenetic protein associated with SpoVID
MESNMPMSGEWKMIESPNIQFEEDIKFQKMPNIHFEESPMNEREEMMEAVEAMAEAAAEEKVESMVEEEFEESPMMMPMESMEMPATPPEGMGAYGQYAGYQAYPMSPCGCQYDCGCGQPYSQMPQMPCGCGQGQMYPVAPVQQMNYCNSCSQPIQAMPYHQHHHHQQMMPYPYTNWPGNY